VVVSANLTTTDFRFPLPLPHPSLPIPIASGVCRRVFLQRQVYIKNFQAIILSSQHRQL